MNQRKNFCLITCTANMFSLSIITRNKFWLVAILVLCLASPADAQKKKPAQKTLPKKTTTNTTNTIKTKTTDVKKTPPANRDVSTDEKRVKDIIAFLQYMMNTLGSSSTSSRDKEVLVTESYSKIFRDGKVQVEDDLDEGRIVVTNKDIVPYLKDVDFFFRDVKFEFNIEDIKSSTLPNGGLFYKVSTRRILTGITTDGESVTNSIPRYIEINYDPTNQDLRIVSMYTHEINEKAVLTNWWFDLSPEWRKILLKKLPIVNPSDSLLFSDIKKITLVEDLDISNNTTVQNLEPLDRFQRLKFLDLSGTNITDLTPLRNLTELETLDLSHTKTSDLTPLRYANKMTNLDISHTLISDIAVLEKMSGLQLLRMNATPVLDFQPLTFLTKLQHADLAQARISNLAPLGSMMQMVSLDISGTPVQDISPLQKLTQLKSLDIDSTQVSRIDALANAENLGVLHANHTRITDLTALQKLKNLEKVYVDHTGVTESVADHFMSVNPNVHVIFDSDNLKSWWSDLSSEWQEVLSKTASVSSSPSKEELFKISRLDSVNVSNRQRVNNLEPLRKLSKLKIILANGTEITSLSPLRENKDIVQLDISETNVADVSILNHFSKLKILRADKSKIENAELLTLPSLEVFYADQTALHDITAREFLEKNPKCLLLFKTIHLNRWWKSLSPEWKEVFRMQLAKDTTSTRENLHRLTEQETLHIKDSRLKDLNALSEFVRLKELHFSGTGIRTLPALENLKSLTSLHAISSPLQKIESLSTFTQLQDLDISNTPVEDLKVIGSLPELKKINCSGTQIKRLDPLLKLQQLEYLDCSNTNVSKLDAIEHLSLKRLTCYNTKISNRAIENYKAKHPDCEVVYYR